MVKHAHKHIHHDQLELIQFYDKTIGVVRICNLTNIGLKNICLGYKVKVKTQFQELQHIAFSLASRDTLWHRRHFAASWSRTASVKACYTLTSTTFPMSPTGSWILTVLRPRSDPLVDLMASSVVCIMFWFSGAV